MNSTMPFSCFDGVTNSFIPVAYRNTLIFLDSFVDIDGAYFGTTFPHLFFMTYGHHKPQKAAQNYVPRVFGFKMHKP